MQLIKDSSSRLGKLHREDSHSEEVLDPHECPTYREVNVNIKCAGRGIGGPVRYKERSDDRHPGIEVSFDQPLRLSFKREREQLHVTSCSSSKP